MQPARRRALPDREGGDAGREEAFVRDEGEARVDVQLLRDGERPLLLLLLLPSASFFFSSPPAPPSLTGAGRRMRSPTSLCNTPPASAP